jgi:hypothetical protein
LRSQASAVLAVDFFCVETVTLPAEAGEADCAFCASSER